MITGTRLRPLDLVTLYGAALCGLFAFGCSSGREAAPGGSVIGAVGSAGQQPAGCTSDEGCTTGSYCSEGACVSDCAPEAEEVCLAGCAADGRCLGAPLGFRSGPAVVSLSDAGVAEPQCIEVNVQFERITPTVTLLIDQSGSMGDEFDSGVSRWDTVVDTLTDAESSLLKQLEDTVRFGLALYTSEGGFGAGDPPRECPMLSQVRIALGNFGRISDVLQTAEPVRDTPTAESLQAIAAQLALFEEEGPKAIILATDGEPDTCVDSDAHDDQSRALSVAAVEAAYSQGIATHVISVGDDISADHLKDLAVAGAGGDAEAEAFTALDTSELVAAFETIISGVRTCDFKLEGRVEPGDAERGTVTLDGEPLGLDDPDGWTMPDPESVRILGAACEQLTEAATGLDISFPCDAIRLLR